MNVIPITTKTKCGYCLESDRLCVKILFREGKAWKTTAIFACRRCRENLHGRFKFAE